MYNLIKNKYMICYFQSIHTIQTMQLEAHSHHAPLTQAIATYADGEYRKPVEYCMETDCRYCNVGHFLVRIDGMV